MRARQNLFFEKVPFLENKKRIKIFFKNKDLIIFEYNIGIKEHKFGSSPILYLGEQQTHDFS